MRFLGKILKRMFILMLTIVLPILCMRQLNAWWFGRSYQEVVQSDGMDQSYYTNPSDLSLYPKDEKGVQINPFASSYLNGFEILPDEKAYPGAIAFFGGSEGSPSYELALEFAKKGFKTYALFYFGLDNQQAELADVPLEFFEEFLDYYQESYGELPAPLTLYGASKGAELALELASQYKEIDLVVLSAPSAYHFFGLTEDNQDRPSWSLKGQALPYLSTNQTSAMALLQMISAFIFNYPVNYGRVYQGIIDNASVEDLEAARIKVENYKGDLLIFAGEDDQMWPSASMAQTIQDHCQSKIDLHLFPSEGHIFSQGPYLQVGQGSFIQVGGQSDPQQKARQEFIDGFTKKLEALYE